MSYKKSAVALAIFASIYSSNLFGQTDTIFVNEIGVPLPKEKASYYRIISSKENDGVQIKEYYLNHKLHSIGHYTNENAIIKNGEFVYFNADGFKSSEGEYKNGFKTGEWIYYSDEGKKVNERQVYNYPQKTYYSVQYRTEYAGKYREGMIDEYEKKSGLWKEYFPDSDSIKLLSNYEAGVKQGQQIEFYQNGKVKRKEYYDGYEINNTELYNEQGKKIKYYPAFQYPKPPEPLRKYLSVRVKCFDAELKKNNIQFKIKVLKDGSATEIEILNVSDEFCKNEMMKALGKIKKWAPAKYENKVINYTIDGTIKYRSLAE